MTPNKTLQLYTALKLHFTSESYDFFKYQGKLKNPVDYTKRRDKWQITKLAKHDDPQGLILANLIKNPKIWIGDIISAKGINTYNEWRKHQESLGYFFCEEIRNIVTHKSFELYTGEPNEYPKLLSLYLGEKISLDTMVILKEIVKFDGYWNKMLKGDLIWKQLSFLIRKYSSFMDLSVETKRRFARMYIENRHKHSPTAVPE